MEVESEPCECVRKTISSRGNRKGENLRWDFVLTTSLTEKRVKLEGTEGRN